MTNRIVFVVVLEKFSKYFFLIDENQLIKQEIEKTLEKLNRNEAGNFSLIFKILQQQESDRGEREGVERNIWFVCLRTFWLKNIDGCCFGEKHEIYQNDWTAKDLNKSTSSKQRLIFNWAQNAGQCLTKVTNYCKNIQTKRNEKERNWQQNEEFDQNNY